MPSRARKEERLKDNVDKAVERWKRNIEMTQHRRVSPDEKQKMRAEFVKSTNRIDKTKLHEVWND